jgi:hypothetical protein
MLTPWVLLLFLLAQSPAPLSLSTKLHPGPHFDATAPTNDLHDTSDWWSILGQDDSELVANVQVEERELARSNFRILGISLTEKMFDKAAAKLGKAQVVNRGDASSGRSQACYVSTTKDEKEEKIHLIFEQGEVAFNFYLFSGGPDWYGSDRCASSNLVSRDLATVSGLHLGMTPSQLIAILGKPTTHRPHEFVYFVHARKRTSPADLKKAREAHPGLNDEEFHNNWDFYGLNAYIAIKFAASKVIYLAVSESETY